MRRVSAAVFALAACFFLYMFGVWGAFTAGIGARPYTSAVPFRLLGQNFPFDAAMLASGVWALGLCLYFALTGDNRKALPSHVPATSLWAQRLQTQPSNAPMASMFLINALLLATFLFMTCVGTRAGSDHTRTVGILAGAAGLHVAAGLILLVLAIFEKPRGVTGLSVGGVAYALGTALAVAVFVWGRPIT
jgi:hypothetical protein